MSVVMTRDEIFNELKKQLSELFEIPTEKLHSTQSFTKTWTSIVSMPST